MGWDFGGDLNRAIKNTSGYDPGTGTWAPTTPFQGVEEGYDRAFPSDGGDNKGSLNQLADDVVSDNRKEAKKAKTAEELRQQQLDVATGIEGQGFKNDVYNQFRTKRFKDLATDQSATQKSMAHRGLLGPGAEGVQARNFANASVDMAAGKNKIRSFADEQAAQIRASVLTQGLQQRQTQQYMKDVIYNSALADYQAKRAAQNQFMTGAGMVIGAGIA